MKITLDKLDVDQWEELENLLNSPPNKLHEGEQGQRYGHYLHVSAQAEVKVDDTTGKAEITGYNNVALEVYNSFEFAVHCGTWLAKEQIELIESGKEQYKRTQSSERELVRKGLADLLYKFLK